ncbi:Dolichyl-phosphate-mannose-protein mannosyltransferase [Tritrichomonas foetus]|uniref:Dolichyl-phosphate-mannose-protein mannosyltransferase n=1 Tax=Tritrichomonas foetus TaxID=1144522 RepID=A0A1J4K4S5_9EUKA|nr:Dolichyl-phosphate-mannose-protein mannosyltransferase [Tritrichomonas foetus]|eukprot:OHT04501.1 Dolichyl-phosphate-mannose-protein mannosyltransferase [Tritrichomonas foetus]
MKVFNTLDCFILIFLTIIALMTRIWLISSIDSITFDEVYFGNFTNYYINRTYFHDIHPPLAKLTMAFIAYLTGYKGTIDFNHKSKYYYSHDEINYVSLRLTPAVFQSFCFPLIFASLRCLNFRTFTAFSAAFSLLFEPSILTEGRFILSDGLLHFYSCLNVFAVTLYIQDFTTHLSWFASLTLGAAISCKHTAFGLIALNAIVHFIWIYKYKPLLQEVVKKALQFLFSMIFIFFFTYFIHFIILIYDGPGTDYMRDSDQITFLKESSFRGLLLMGPSLLSRTIYLTFLTFAGHMSVMKEHPYESKPQYWPLLLDKAMCFTRFENRSVMCIGSPLIYWPSTFSLIVTFVCLIMSKKTDYRHFFLLFGWSVSYFPFFLIPRSMFLYHYIIPLIFSVMCQAAIIESLFARRYPFIQYFLHWLMNFSGIASYIIWYPIVYGTECNDCLAIREWFSCWSLSSRGAVTTNSTM